LNLEIYKKMEPNSRSIYVGLSGGLLIGALAFSFAKPFVPEGVFYLYWLAPFMIANSLELIAAFFLRIDMSPPFSCVLRVESEKDKKHRILVVLMAALLIIPLLAYSWIKEFFYL